MITIERTTKETSITVGLDMSSAGAPEISTGVPFFDHMLRAAAFHGAFTLCVAATGDIDVDAHHLVEDVGLVLGDALRKTFTKLGAVTRYGHSVIPMDDALCEVAIDVCERPYLVFALDFPQPSVGTFDTSLLREFFTALANRAAINLHVVSRHGLNSHHIVEAAFKALGKALKTAYTPLESDRAAMSTKGTL